MLENIPIESVLFLDIETVPNAPSFDQLDERTRKLWERKAEKLIVPQPGSPDKTPADIYSRAGIYAEFGRIICISVGAFAKSDFRIKSFAGDDEFALLTDFAALLNSKYNGKDHRLCAHNGKEFDFPFIARRMLINGIKLPVILDLGGKKPWEVNHLDTMELWKFGDIKNYTSLETLAAVFNISTPKDDIDGSMVAEVYYGTGDLPRIIKYCSKDVLTVAQIFRRYRGEPLISDEHVTIV